MLDVLFVALFQVVSGDPAAAAPATETPPAAEAQPSPATPDATAPTTEEPVVCRRQSVMGSRVRSEMICSTASQDAERRRVAREAIRRNEYRTQGQNLGRGGGR